MVDLRFDPAAVLDITGSDRRILIISDFHMGMGRRDDLAPNRELLLALLERYYLERDWYLVLNGDIEELQRYQLAHVRENWSALYSIFDRFNAEKRLYKIVGNHDESLLFEKNYPYSLYQALQIKTESLPVYVYHGHQGSRIYTDYNHLVGASLRYVLKPFGIRNISSARSPYRRFFVEKKAYAFSLKHKCISIIGHTHRALFASLGRFDYIKFEIERLCRDYPASRGAERERIAREVQTLRLELGKLGRAERRHVLRQSLYGDELPVPCLFNSGSAIGRKGINAIELDSRSIALVYWFRKGEGKHFINRGSYEVEEIPGSACYRGVLNRDRLEFVKSRIELLGSSNTN
jgi:UDP-2,3-diacylglucosamine pyrophosphatase LpxH